jgi:hypothetical protein
MPALAHLLGVLNPAVRHWSISYTTPRRPAPHGPLNPPVPALGFPDMKTKVVTAGVVATALVTEPVALAFGPVSSTERAEDLACQLRPAPTCAPPREEPRHVELAWPEMVEPSSNVAASQASPMGMTAGAAPASGDARLLVSPPPLIGAAVLPASDASVFITLGESAWWPPRR